MDVTGGPDQVGDEALEIYRATGLPVYVDAQRKRAVETLIEHCSPDIILSDDGLQHYAMPRAMELVVVNNHLGFGNGHCLPVGPLREDVSRLHSVDFVLLNQVSDTPHSSLNPFKQGFHFTVVPSAWVNIHTGEQRGLDFIPGKAICAYAGIGQPDKFFHALQRLGLSVHPCPRADHARYQTSDFASDQFDAYVMTAKDAVKCRDLAPENTWYLQVKTTLDAEFSQQFLQRLETIKQ